MYVSLGCVWCLIDTTLHAISDVQRALIVNSMLKTLGWKTGLYYLLLPFTGSTEFAPTVRVREGQDMTSSYCPRCSCAWSKCGIFIVLINILVKIEACGPPIQMTNLFVTIGKHCHSWVDISASIWMFAILPLALVLPTRVHHGGSLFMPGKK